MDVSTTISEELKISRLEGPEQEAFLNLWRTQEVLLSQMSELYKSYDISVVQYNALRILRGAGRDGLPCQRVSERLVSRVPDITRLLDRLETKGLISRTRDRRNDRRVVTARIEAKGLKLLKSLDEPVRQCHRGQFGHLTRRELKELNRLLNKVRQPGGRGRKEQSK
jgi:DNA-binding MarR family transcriptional regulator